MNSNSDKFLKLNELIESHLDPLKMTVDLHQQILQSFLLICQEKNLVDDSTGETFYPIPYQEITECIYASDFEFSDELNSVIEGLIEPLKKLLKLDGLTSDELKLEKNRKANHQLNAYKRFVSHIQLAVCQKVFISKETLKVSGQIYDLKNKIFDLEGELRRAKVELSDSRTIIAKSLRSVRTSSEIAKDTQITVETLNSTITKLQEDTNKALISAQRAQKDAEESKTQFVTILGIFASIIIALFGGMSLVKAAVELLTNEGSLPVFVFAVSILLLSFTLLIMLLTSWILALNTKNDRNYNLFKAGMIVSLLSVIGISSLVIITK
ncbi:hypothetical protein [Acinetobacter sp. YH12126]|uniref:hypothetical protein n=1 Tax=Acinetobacter sp. YH12126 TaxID=2601111 RepID=UPI0015D45AE4|nr:hypothetical protein [Acinetobacter sp. YH12126]